VAWVQTDSLSFSARHESEDEEAAVAILDDLEDFRDRLAALFATAPAEVSVVIHAHPGALALAHPWLPMARVLAAPAARRYMAGWFAQGEIHVLAPDALEERAARVEGSREALMLTPMHEYAHLVIGANNYELPPPFTFRTFARYVRWAWLCEGAATHFAGQGPHLRAAILRRLREGPRPAFPPDARDAPLLGATVFALLERERGAQACAELASGRLSASGPQPTVERAFERHFSDVERAWRESLEQHQ
jgi:hypothetical protein